MKKSLENHKLQKRPQKREVKKILFVPKYSVAKETRFEPCKMLPFCAVAVSVITVLETPPQWVGFSRISDRSE